jgi:phosphomannomutase
VVDASFVGALVGLEVLRGSGNRGHMFYDLRSSMMVPEVWQAHGATVSMCPVGHALIKKILKDEGGIFASELSLHQYFHSMYDVESSDLSLLYILQALSREQKPLSALIQPLKKYAHSGEINFEIHDKQAVIKKIEEHYTSTALEILHLDGLYMKFTWGWFNVRTSNTEPVLRLNLETFDKTILSQKIKELTTCMLEK